MSGSLEDAASAALAALQTIQAEMEVAEENLYAATRSAEAYRRRYIAARTEAEDVRDRLRKAETALRDANRGAAESPTCRFESEIGERCTRQAEYRLRVQEAPIVRIFGDQSGDYTKCKPDADPSYSCSDHLVHMITDRFVTVERR